jgi:simple sugar transport system permease protein
VAALTTRWRSLPNRELYVILALIVALMSALHPRFATFANLTSMAYQLPILAFLSIGMMVSMLSGGINLAIIATTNFTGIVTALVLRALVGTPMTQAPLGATLLAMAAGLAAALAVGAFMGLLVGYVRVPAILATLGVMTLLTGINIVLTRGYTVTGFPPFLLAIGNGIVYGVPIPFVIFVAVTLALAVVINRTAFGFDLYMLGSNPIAARYSNVNVRFGLLRVYVISALFSAVTSFIMTGQLNSVKANYAETYLLVAVLACFLGGIDPFGGTGRLSGMVLSVIILQLISTGVNLLRMDPFFIQAMWGLIILVVIAANFFGARLREGRRLRALQAERRTALRRKVKQRDEARRP